LVLQNWLLSAVKEQRRSLAADAGYRQQHAGDDARPRRAIGRHGE
jgi:hypothetical protein